MADETTPAAEPEATPAAEPAKSDEAKKSIELNQIINQIFERRTKFVEQIRKIEQSNLSDAQKTQEMLIEEELLEQSILEIKKQNIQFAQLENQLLEKKIAISEQEKALIKAKQELAKDYATKDEKLIQQQKAGIEAIASALESLRDEQSKIKQEYDKLNKSIDDSIAKMEKMNEVAVKVKSTLSGLYQAESFSAFAGKASEILEIFKKTDVESVRFQVNFQKELDKTSTKLKLFGSQLTVVGKSFAESFSIPIIGTQISGLMETAQEVMRGPAEAFKKFGYTTKEFEASINSSRSALAGLGVTEKELREAMGNLNKNFAQFRDLQPQVRDAMLADVAALEKMGFASDMTTKVMARLQNTMGFTGQEARKQVKEIAQLGQVMGLGTKTMEDFAALAPKLEVFGKKGVEVFKDTAAAAQFLGVEASRLYDKMSQYDSFEKAADAAGELNLALGGQFIDSLELMRASIEGGPTDTLRLLNKGIRESGVNINEMKGAMLKFHATAAGMGDDIELFKKVATFDDTKLNQFITSQKAAAEKQEELTQAAKKAQDVFMGLQAAFASAFKDESTMEGMKALITGITKIATTLATVMGKIEAFVPIMSGFVALFAVGKIVQFANGIYKNAMAVEDFMRKVVLKKTVTQQDTVAQQQNNQVTLQGASASTGAAAAERADAAAKTGGIGATTADTASTGTNTAAQSANAGSRLAVLAAKFPLGTIAAAGIMTLIAGIVGKLMSMFGGEGGATAGGLPVAVPSTAVPKATVGTAAVGEPLGGTAPTPASVEDGLMIPASIGGATIQLPTGKTAKTSASDEIVALKEGGLMAGKFDTMIKSLEKANATLEKLAAKEMVVNMDGRRVNERLAQSNYENPYNQV